MSTPASSTDPSPREQLGIFPIGRPQGQASFVARLAAENCWTQAYAQRVLREYRRFLILNTRDIGAVRPSDAVEQAWRLHMLHPRSYFDDLCDGILGRRLDYVPNDGDDDRERVVREYRDGLDEYRRAFGYAAPADIWPSPEAFAAALGRFRRVRLAPLLRTTRTRTALFAVGTSATALALSAGLGDLLLPLLILLAGTGAAIAAPLWDTEPLDDGGSDEGGASSRGWFSSSGLGYGGDGGGWSGDGGGGWSGGDGGGD